MDWLQVVVLSVIQGLTEFLPISSSAHLILVPVLTDWTDQGLVFDVAMHLGSLMAVVIYFRAELRRMVLSWATTLGSARHGRVVDPDARLAWWVLLATIPVCVVGFALHDYIEASMRSPFWIAGGLIVFGLLLAYADWKPRQDLSEYQLTLRHAMLVGLSQVLALIPGTSRSGITITAALLLGLSRESAARFSFLLSIPVIILASGLEIVDLMQEPQVIDWTQLITGVLLSGLSAYLCIHYFLAFIKRIGMQPFVVYRVVLGLWLLWIFW
ncbi:undecaprenyl-diphosphate phosphatase [Billgrantia antri]|uniref:undecaprenyl-diphosphate phosphatase n=1 Tax=Billgrantia antri TaxID=2846777 RepID=UPI003B214646